MSVAALEPSELVDVILRVGLFSADWYAAVHGDVAKSGLSAEAHFRQFGLLLGRHPCPDFARRVAELPIHLIQPDVQQALAQRFSVAAGAETVASDITPPEFNEAFYLQTNPGIDLSKCADPYAHFLKWGHRDLRNPSPDFDLVWYTQNYGQEFSSPDENPFLHYLREGKAQGKMGHPPRPARFDARFSKPLPKAPRRACLFASYDPHLRIDDYVIIYLRELARHADVFYLADCEMPASELAKLDGIVKGGWAERHGAYDFGSYSKLARDLVGWDRLADYDEVLFVNDSCYLVRPLDEVFAAMGARPCAWWGLQATKGLAATRANQRFPAEDRLQMNTLDGEVLGRFDLDPIYDFHIGSYFLAFRRDVVSDSGFQRVMNAVDVQKSKYTIVRKYEVGLTRFLIGNGYGFETWLAYTTRRHPVYTAAIFDLIRDGFPLFKRYFVTDNPYRSSALAYWPTALNGAQSQTPVAMIDANVRRLARAEKLYENYTITTEGGTAPAPYSREVFAAYDLSTPKYDHFWGFPVCHFDHTLSDNSRAVFEAVKNDPSITKVIFTRSQAVETDGVNVITVPLNTLEGQMYLARCRHFFVRHGVNLNIEWPLAEGRHNVINLWHGIPLKRIGFASLDLSGKQERWEADNRALKAVIAASDVDRLAMTAAYWPLTFNDIWLTGLPRHDFITTDEKNLSAVLSTQLRDIRNRKAGRRMILFCPTFRNDQKYGYYKFKPDEIAQLSEWLEKNGYVLAIREHPADKRRQYSSQLRGTNFIQVPAVAMPDVEMLYREADMLITDYSSVFIDYMLTGRPAVSFAYDRKKYETQERGLFYDLNKVFPGPVVEHFADLMRALESMKTPMSREDTTRYQECRDFFIKFTDDGNACRVVEKVRSLQRGSELAKGFEKVRGPHLGKMVVFLYNPAHGITNRYRVFALLPELRKRGWTGYALDYRTAPYDLLARADIVSLCRLELSSRTLDLVEGARACGAKILYDTDDLLHDLPLFSESEYFCRDLTLTNSLRKLSVDTQALMRMADGFTLSTAPLAASVATFGKPAEVIANTLSTEIAAAYALPPHRDPKAPVRIAYLSGTATHSRDFVECFSALAAVLPEFPEAELHIVGPMNLPESASPAFLAQTRHHGLMSYQAMHDFLRGMDINLAPLSPSQFNDAKSELKIFEAALHRVPSIASPSATYRQTIESWETGVLATTEAEWAMALRTLVRDRILRDKMGQYAYDKITPRFAACTVAERLSRFMEHLANAH